MGGNEGLLRAIFVFEGGRVDFLTNADRPAPWEIMTERDHSTLSKAMKKAIDRENLVLTEAGADALLLKLTIDGAGTVLAAMPPAYVDPAAGRTEMLERMSSGPHSATPASASGFDSDSEPTLAMTEANVDMLLADEAPSEPSGEERKREMSRARDLAKLGHLDRSSFRVRCWPSLRVI